MLEVGYQVRRCPHISIITRLTRFTRLNSFTICTGCTICNFGNLPNRISKVVVVTTDDFEAAEELDVEEQTPFVSSKRTTMSEDAFADFVVPLPPSGQVLNSSNKSSKSSRK